MGSAGQGKRQAVEIATKVDGALRCHCGSLLARLVPQGVEIKCRRCKRRVVLPLGSDAVENQNRASSGESPVRF